MTAQSQRERPAAPAARAMTRPRTAPPAARTPTFPQTMTFPREVLR